MGLIKELVLLPWIVVGVIVFVGLLLQKKPIEDVFRGTIKSVIGFEIIIIGGQLISESVVPFGKMFQYAFHITGIMLNVEAVTGVVVKEYGVQVSIIMVLGLIANLILAKITRYRYVFVTGQHVLYMACMIVCVLNAYHVKGIIAYLDAALAMGISMVLMPAILQKYTVRICGNDMVAMGHFGSSSYLMAAWLGKIYGEDSRSIEKIRIPKRLSFLRDTAVTVTITMIVMYMVVAYAAGSTYIEQHLSNGKNYMVYALTQAMEFSAGFVVVTTGIRLFISEIVPAVKGFADRWLPNARAAIDCPFIFPYAPNALLVGFLFSFLGGLFSMGFMSVCGLTVILPGIVSHFFCGATAGVYGNSTGGIRGTCIGGFVNGVYMSFLPLLFLPHIGRMANASVTFPDEDLGLVGLMLGSWIRRVGPYQTFLILIGIVIIMVLLPEMIENREEGRPWFIGEDDIYKDK